jgi:hypothetical protein
LLYEYLGHYFRKTDVKGIKMFQFSKPEWILPGARKCHFIRNTAAHGADAVRVYFAPLLDQKLKSRQAVSNYSGHNFCFDFLIG